MSITRLGPRSPVLSAHLLAASIGVLVAVAPSLAVAREPSAPPVTRTDDLSARPPAPGERALEGRLFAPCCYTQTLDVHESESARELRLEIRGRLYAGESAVAVERGLVARYGERLRAVPEPDPMRFVAPGVLLIAGLAALGVLGLLRRWRDRSALVEAPGRLVAEAPDAYDQRLDAELRDLD